MGSMISRTGWVGWGVCGTGGGGEVEGVGVPHLGLAPPRPHLGVVTGLVLRPGVGLGVLGGLQVLYRVELLRLPVGQPQVGEVVAQLVLHVSNVRHTLRPASPSPPATESPHPPHQAQPGARQRVRAVRDSGGALTGEYQSYAIEY